MGVIKNLEDQILELKGEKDQIEFAIEEQSEVCLEHLTNKKLVMWLQREIKGVDSVPNIYRGLYSTMSNTIHEMPDENETQDGEEFGQGLSPSPSRKLV